jgi:hypothetical protein
MSGYVGWGVVWLDETCMQHDSDSESECVSVGERHTQGLTTVPTSSGTRDRRTYTPPNYYPHQQWHWGQTHYTQRHVCGVR